LEFKIQTIEKLFTYMDEVVIYSYLIIPLIFLFNKNKKREVLSIVIYGIVFFFLLFFFFDVPKSLRGYYQSFYTFLEYAFFAYFFWLNIKNKKVKQLIILLSFAFVGFQIIYSFATKFTRLDVLAVGIESILLFLYIFYFFYEHFGSPRNQFIYNNYCFWLSVGLLIYLGGSFFINILANEMEKSEKDKYWNLTYIAEIIKNVLFVVALLVFSRWPQENTQNKPSQVPFLDLI
jgi:hypothetical protein